MKQCAALLLVAAVCTSTIEAQLLNKFNSPSVVSQWKSININSVNATISNDGIFSDYRKTESAGVEWPKGSSKKAVYSSGLWIVGKHRPTDSLRTAVMEYLSEYQPGKILTTFNTTSNNPNAADDPAKPEYRLYEAIRGLKEGDHALWPVHLGAPFADIDKNGLFDPAVDRSARWGDQLLWTISNDADSADHATVATTLPMGVELQSTFFAYDIPGALDHTVFLRYKIINKSDADYDSLYFGYWGDIDAGDANDDMVAADTVREMFYVYNVDNNDEGGGGYGAQPPATGFLLLQGPSVFTGQTSDSAWSEGVKRSGYKNLGMKAFVTYPSGGAGIGWVDPGMRTSWFAKAAHNNMQGLIGRYGTPMIDPTTDKQNLFAFPGDPVSETGWLHKHTSSPCDVRALMSTGPITLAKNDTQEIVIAYIIAQGTDRLASITKLRGYADTVRQIFQSGFSSPLLTHNGPHAYVAYDEWEQKKGSFGNHLFGGGHDTIAFTLGNTGTDSLEVNFGAMTNASFSRISPQENSLKLPPGATRRIVIGFDPLSPGAKSDSLTILFNDPSNPKQVFYFSGTGVQLQPAVSGSLYASGISGLYTLSSTGGGAVFETAIDTDVMPTGIAVQPGSKELFSIVNNKLVRIDVSTGLTIAFPYSFGGYSFTGGISFMNDSILIAAADSIIAFVNTKTGSLDTLHRFTNSFSIRGLSYRPATNEIYFTINSEFMQPDTIDAVYKIHAATKSITRVGRTAFNNRVRSLVFDKNGKLYGLSSVGGSSSLIDINTATGAGTLIGSTGVTGLLSLAMDPNAVADVRKENGSIPESFALFQNYPNPFNPATVITYHLPAASAVTLELFDLLGRKLATLVDEVQERGRYTYRLDAAAWKLSTGIYFYQLRSGSFRGVKKMSVVK